MWRVWNRETLGWGGGGWGGRCHARSSSERHSAPQHPWLEVVSGCVGQGGWVVRHPPKPAHPAPRLAVHLTHWPAPWPLCGLLEDIIAGHRLKDYPLYCTLIYLYIFWTPYPLMGIPPMVWLQEKYLHLNLFWHSPPLYSVPYLPAPFLWHSSTYLIYLIECCFLPFPPLAYTHLQWCLYLLS